MKRLKNYMLLLSALAFILLGAAMPYLTSQIQDAQVIGLQKKLELNTVNLTLRQEGDVGPVLQLISQPHTESSWEGETVLSKTDACQAALTVLETMDQYDLLPEGAIERFRETQGHAQPQLLMGEDGSSALIWTWTWYDAFGTFITLDDATGKAVRILSESEPTDSYPVESTRFRLEKWIMFLQDYYGMELTDIEESIHSANVTTKSDSYVSSDGSARFDLCFSAKGGTELYDLKLEIEYNWDLFNYQ